MTPAGPNPSPPHFLVTAGGTREPIDRVRDWGNIFSGNTGFEIAKALSNLGEVTLVTSNAAHLARLADSFESRFPIRGESFRSYEDLKGLLERLVRPTQFAGVFMTAAVSDYTPDGAYHVLERQAHPSADGTQIWVVRPAQAGKIKSTFDQIAILGRRTEKLVDLFRAQWQFKGLLVKFKLEVGISTEQLLQIGHASRAASAADYLVANTLDIVDGPNAGAYLLWAENAEWVPRKLLAPRLATLAADHLHLPIVD